MAYITDTDKDLIMSDKETEFLRESNAIEGVFSDEALQQSKMAWIMACVNAKDGINLDYIKEIHRRLMKDLNPRIAGNLRKCKVFVGERECMEWQQIKVHLEGLCKQIPKSEFAIKKWHVEFEKIHPFEDGNGRTGRILMNIQRLNIGLPILVIHTGYEQMQYYKWWSTRK